MSLRLFLEGTGKQQMDFIKLTFLNKNQYNNDYIGVYYININHIISIKLREEYVRPNIIGEGNMTVPETITVLLCGNEIEHSIKKNDNENKEAYKILKNLTSSPLHL